MDIKKHMRVLLTLPVLDALGDEYTGTIKDIVLEKTKNKYKGFRIEESPLISFMENGHYFIPNEKNKEVLWEVYGEDTNLWLGKRISVYSSEICRLDGEGSGAYEKVVECLDPVESLDPSPESTLHVKDEPERSPAGTSSAYEGSDACPDACPDESEYGSRECLELWN